MRSWFGFLLTKEVDLGDRFGRLGSTIGALSLLLGILAIAHQDVAASPRPVSESDMPPGSVALDDACVRVPMPFKKTKKWLIKHFGERGAKVEFKTMIDLPGVYAQHAVIADKNTRGNSLNVSRYYFKDHF